jgi:calcium-dependent protein kinase
MSRCDHPSIIKLYEIFEDSRYIDLVMEQCLGGSLLDRLIKKMEEEDETYSEAEAAIIFKQIITAISYCHNQGICHRDIKLENVLFLTNQKNSPIKLIDFGLSKYIKRRRRFHNKNGKNYETMNMRSIVGSPHYISPEVLKGKYTQKCDIWSAGIVLYVMLVGYFPFDGDTDNEVYKAISKSKIDLNTQEWKSISKEAKDLIKHMLCEEGKRYSAAEVLKHPWLVKLSPNTKGAVNNISLKHLLNYKNSTNFKKFILTYMATRLKEKDIQELKKIFLELDVNKDGTLSVEEIKKCFIKLNKNQHLNISNKEIEDIFKSIDINNSKRIEYTEFITSMIEESNYCKEEKLIEIFRLLDKDGSGKISKDEIKKALNDEKIRDEDLNSFIKKCDLNGDGEIDYYEFVTCMSDLDKDKK